MNKLAYKVLAWLAVLSLWFPTTTFAIDLSGTCAGTIPAGDHLLIGGCTVPAGQTLTFESGANLQGGSNVIDISGTVNGSDFTVQNGNFVVQSGGELNLDQMTYSGLADYISYLDGSSGFVTNSNFNMGDTNSPPHVIQIDGASPNISGNTINANSGVQIAGDGANPTVSNNIFSFKTIGITFSDAMSTGTVNSNTFNFLSSVFSTAIHVNGDASPSITGNTINNDGSNTDIGINLAIKAGSSVQVSSNNICATNDDMPLIVGPDFFANSSSATISGNNLSCGWARGIGLGGTTTASGTLTSIQGQSEFFLRAPLIISAADVFTINSGKIVSYDFKTIVVDGALTASNATIDNTYILARPGGSLNLNQMALTGTDYIIQYVGGSAGSITNSQIAATTSETIKLIDVAPVISGNTFSGMAVGLTASNSNLEPIALNIQDNIFNDVITGISLSGSINATISGNNFNRNSSAISLSGDAVMPIITSNVFSQGDLSLNFLDDAALFSANANIIESNFFNGVKEYIGFPTTIVQSGVVPAIPTSYKVVTTINVQDAIELTFSPGIDLQFEADVGVLVDPGGSLIVGDSSGGETVQFSKISSSSSPWIGISVAGDAALYNCSVSFALTGLTITDGIVPITGCGFAQNQTGVLVSGTGASVAITESSITGNAINGINRVSGDISISQSYIAENGGWGIYNADSSSYVSAENNDWGDVSGPLDDSDDTGTGGLYNPAGQGQTVSDYVDYDPWQGKTGPTVPDAPTIDAATPANTGALIAFTPPGSDGGAAILDYTASCSAGTNATGSTSPLLVTGLTNNVTYNCNVTARNSVGNSFASGNVAVTPTDGGDVTLPPSDGGPGEVVTFTHTATSPSGGAPVTATLEVVAADPSPPEPPPAEADSLVAAIDISSTGSVAGYQMVITFEIDPGSMNVFTGFWKYGKEAPGDTPHWYDYGPKGVVAPGTGFELSADRKTLTVYFTDGKRGDDDLEVNARIIDPALPIIQIDPLIFKDGFD